jgi:transcriptional regulator with XRE-family HTH domain
MRRLSISEAARQLGISRQAFHSYLNGSSVPRQNTLARAMQLWDFHITVGERTFDKSSVPLVPGHRSPPEQLAFWGALDSIEEKDLKVRVKREGARFKVAVEIDLPA